VILNVHLFNGIAVAPGVPQPVPVRQSSEGRAIQVTQSAPDGNKTQTITKIPPIKIMSEYDETPTVIGCILLIFLFLVGIVMFFAGISENEIVLMLGGIFISGIIAGRLFYLLRGGKYKIGKTFLFHRMTKEKLKKIANISLIAYALLTVIITLVVILGEANFLNILIALGFCSGCHVWLKSIKFHEDIDYVANDALSELAEINIDEKIAASCQNFDNTKIKYKKNDNIIVVTNRKIFFAVFDGTNWLKLNKLMGEIQKIGIGNKKYGYYLKLIFSDNISLGIRLDESKMTTMPQLFLRQFLNTLDAYLSGHDVVPATSRRRVSVSTESVGKSATVTPGVRKIEISDTLSKELKNAEEVKPGRKLEI
jgi:hypothetical protein